MTQEIYGYFLTRSFLLAKEEKELVELYNTKEFFEHFIENVVKIIEQEDFILTDKLLQEKVEAVLYEYRFTYNRDKKINDGMNKIIKKFREYKSMTPYEITYRTKKWLLEEKKLRELPSILATTSRIYEGIKKDFANMTIITTTNGMLYPNTILEYTMIVNYMANKFPVILVDEEIRNNIIFNLENAMETIKELKYMVLKKYIKNTIDNLKKLNKEINLELTADEKQKIKSINNN